MHDPHFPEMKKLPLKHVKSGFYPPQLSNKFLDLVRSELGVFYNSDISCQIQPGQYAIKLGLLSF